MTGAFAIPVIGLGTNAAASQMPERLTTLHVTTAAALALVTTIMPAPVCTTHPRRIAAEVVTVNGSGCPAGTAAVAAALDRPRAVW